jgi:hypothetical protein
LAARPAIEIYRRVTGRYPARAGEALVLEAEIESEADRRRWEQVIRCYIGCGWNPQNLSGMLDYYRRGELPGNYRGRSTYRAASKRATGTTPYRVARIEDFIYKGISDDTLISEPNAPPDVLAPPNSSQ